MDWKVRNTEDDCPSQEEGAQGRKKKVNEVGDTEWPRHHHGHRILKRGKHRKQGAVLEFQEENRGNALT